MNRPLITLTALAALLGGCNFYFGDDDSCDFAGPGSNGFGAPEQDPLPDQRDPVSGECVSFGGTGGGGGTTDPCNPDTRPTPVPEEPQADPDWGFCVSQCTGLDQNSCLEAVGCRAIYQLDDAIDLENAPFAECWSTAQSGPVQGGGCDGLDAYQCSRHDDCVAYHATIYDCDAPQGADCAPMPRLGPFYTCGAEPNSNPPPPACPELAEEECITRADCTPLYEGIDCTCQGDACTCAGWVFDVCSV